MSRLNDTEGAALTAATPSVPPAQRAAEATARIINLPKISPAGFTMPILLTARSGCRAAQAGRAWRQTRYPAGGIRQAEL